jgi:hypothetical protein
LDEGTSRLRFSGRRFGFERVTKQVWELTEVATATVVPP